MGQDPSQVFEGDDASTAFVMFVRTGQRHHLAFARVLTGDLPAAEDLLQESLYRVFCAWRRQGAPADPDKYLRATMVRLQRRRARRGWVNELPADTIVESAADQTDPDWVGPVDLLRLLRSLPPRQRAAIALRYLGDMSVAETADQLHCSVSTVKTLTGQAITSLRRRLPIEQECET